MDTEKINVLVVEPEKKPYPKEISSELASLQKEVGGYRTAHGRRVDDRSDAEIPLLRPGRNLRIKEILSKLGRIKMRWAWLRLRPSFT